jgi:diketogulonate reductase-like aldo/keto reductase
MSKIPSIKFSDGNSIPQIGLGLWKIQDPSDFTTAFESAYKAGYKMYDTAQAYKNELFLGQAIKGLRIKRDSLFITSKIAVQNFGKTKTYSSFHQSLKNIDTDYIDLMLLHFPVTIFRKNSWKALEQLKKEGLIKSIGVSNYTIKHLEEMKSYANEMPAVNQVELHIFLQQPELIEYCQKENIVVEAYSPLAHANTMDHPEIIKLAKKHKKSYAQIMLRFLVQKGLVVIPKSINPERIKSNLDIFDFELSNKEIVELTKLDRNLRTCWNPTLVP